MEETGVNIRTARPEDIEQIRQNIRLTLANPEGRSQRKKYEDAILRGEMMVLTRTDTKTRTDKIDAFIEWHTKIDGVVTIRDAGAIGDEPNPNVIRWLVRELLRMVRPPTAGVKVIADQAPWNSVFEGLPGFTLEGREFSRPHWRNIWSWDGTLEPEDGRQGRLRRRR